MDRKSPDETFIEMIKILEGRSTCLRRNVAAILVKDGIILSTGYNGAPKGLKHCVECIRKTNGIPSGQRMEFCRAVHAEQNALIQCALKQTNPKDSTLYCSNSPCVVCAKLLIQAEVKKIIYIEKYNDELAIQMLNEAGIELIEHGGKNGL